jgi:flagellar protein FliO/FliZ
MSTFAQEVKNNNQQATETQGVQFRDSDVEQNQVELKEPMSGAEVIWMLLRVLLALALIIVLIYVLIRFLSRKTRNYDSPRKLRIIAAIGLSPQKSMQVVEVGHKLYVIGVGQDVVVLDKIEHPQEVAELIEMLDMTNIENQVMMNWREKILSIFKKKEITSEELAIEDYEKLFSEQLKEATARENGTGTLVDENKERM